MALCAGENVSVSEKREGKNLLDKMKNEHLNTSPSSSRLAGSMAGISRGSEGKMEI